jgi:hypothetical protein
MWQGASVRPSAASNAIQPILSGHMDWRTVAGMAGKSGRNCGHITASFSMEPSHYAPVKEELADVRQAS